MPIDAWEKYLGDGPFDLVAFANGLLQWMQSHGVRQVEARADLLRIVFSVVTFAGDDAVLTYPTDDAIEKLRRLRARLAFLANAWNGEGTIRLGADAFTLRLVDDRVVLINDAVAQQAVG